MSYYGAMRDAAANVQRTPPAPEPPQTGPTRRIQASPSRWVDSPHTDADALSRLRQLIRNGELRGDFAESLANRRILSERQWPWVHILVVEHERGRDATPSGEAIAMPDLALVRALFGRARAAGLRGPKVRMDTPDVGRVQLQMAGDASRYAGQIVITDGGAFGERRFYGRIEATKAATPDRFFAAAACTPGVARALVDLARDPAAAASAYGRRTGSCCFCGKDLEDGRSIAVGYGPICADKYGLPWGDRTVDTQESLL